MLSGPAAPAGPGRLVETLALPNLSPFALGLLSEEVAESILGSAP